MNAALTALAVALALFSAPPAHAERWERWGGSVSTPTPDAPGEGAMRVARCIFEHHPNLNTIVGWVVEIPAELSDGAHTFRLLDGQMSAADGLMDGPANFDVGFYAGLGSCEHDPPSEPVLFHGPGDEHGVVPAGTTHAIVTVRNKPHSAVVLEIRLD